MPELADDRGIVEDRDKEFYGTLRINAAIVFDPNFEAVLDTELAALKKTLMREAEQYRLLGPRSLRDLDA